MQRTFRIAEISFGKPTWDTAYEFEFQGNKFEVQVFSANYSVDVVERYIKNLRNKVDAFALTNLPPVAKLDEKSYVHRQYLEIMSIPSNVPLCDGTGLREISNINSLVKLIEDGTVNPDLGVFFPNGLLCTELEEFIRTNYAGSVFLGDAYSLFGVPWVVKPFPGLMNISKLAISSTNKMRYSSTTAFANTSLGKVARSSIAPQVEKLRYVVSDLKELQLFGGEVGFIRGKDLIIWSANPKIEEEIRKYSPRSIINLMPEKYRISPYINYGVLDAVLRLSNGRSSSLTNEEWEQIVTEDINIHQLTRKYVNTRKRPYHKVVANEVRGVRRKVFGHQPPDFAFVVHALSYKDLMNGPGLNVLKYVPRKYSGNFESLLAKAPPFVYGEIKHIISEETGKEVNGIIYALAATPKALKQADPQDIYRKIEHICHDSARRGAKILGLGAYIKVIGDQGHTINQNSPIPVTTGNSLSASSTLWALSESVIKMGLVQKSPINGKVDGMAMVIGATGSIGKVSAKLLALAFNKVCLVAPRMERLLELKAEIEKLAPYCEVTVATNANDLAHLADAIVTATSAFDQKIVDIMKIKPGAVVCDCSRPLDFTFDEVKKRPDILVIESGEVVLPGSVDMNFSLNLKGNAVYACLAETALLAMEEKYESFTLGRDIEWHKVKEIYQMARKHGVKLADIQGHTGSISDQEIQLVKKLALERRSSGIIL